LPRSKFGGVVGDNFYGYGRNRFADISLDWNVGYQKLDWGNRYLVFGGLNDLNPLDVPATLRPGAVREEETRIAFPAVFARVALSPATRVEAFYQIHFQRNAPPECGTFFAAQDTLSEGCDKVMLGQGSDRASLATGNYLTRAGTPHPSDAGQGGLAVRHTVDEWATEFGFYAAQFHSRPSFYSAIKSLRQGAPFVPGDPGNLNPQFLTEFPEDIRIFGATFDTRFRGGAVFGEFTFRPNQPLQYNTADILAAITSATAPTPLRAQVTAVAPGAIFHAWERHDAVQLQLGATGTADGVDMGLSTEAGPQSGKLDLTPAQRGYLDDLIAAGVQPSSELRALSIGSYVCQARGAGQGDEAVRDYVAPMVRSDVAESNAAAPQSASVIQADAAIDDYIRIAGQRLC